MSAGWKAIFASVIALSLVGCSQFDVNESPSGTPQSPQRYGQAAADAKLEPTPPMPAASIP